MLDLRILFGLTVPSVTWDSSFETVPAGGSLLLAGDDAIRTFKTATSQRIGREHYGLTTDPQTWHGIHLAGSAIVYMGSAKPTNRPEAGGVALTSGSTSNADIGRVFITNTAGGLIPYVYTSAGWLGFTHDWLRVSIQGTLATANPATPAIVVPRAGRVMKVTARVLTAPTGAALNIDILKNGSTSIFASPPMTIAISGNAVNVSASASFSASAVLAADDYLTINISPVGSPIPGADLSITIDFAVGA